MARSRSFVFTHNNYASTDIQDQLQCRYIIYSKETAPNGTPQLKGCVYFLNAKSLAAATRLLPGCLVENGESFEDAIENCRKQEDFTERGIPPFTQKRIGEIEKRRWQDLWDVTKQGRIEEMPLTWYPKKRRRSFQMLSPKENPN
uniref:hypothetical protein n=1 Tax=Flavobacterium sp. TaxID=239 RepID=UPI0040474C3D